MEFSKRFAVTLKTPISLTIPRMDGSSLIIKTATILVDWPCRLSPTAETPDDIEPREGPQVDLTVIRFTQGDKGSWYEHWKTENGLTDPMSVQVKRDNILSRQEIPAESK